MRNLLLALALLMVLMAVPFLLLAIRDARLLGAGREFRSQRGGTNKGAAFLELMTDAEIEELQAPQLRWVSRTLPDPRTELVSAIHARIYKRFAMERHQSSKVRSEVALIVLSSFLGVVAAGAWTQASTDLFIPTGSLTGWIVAGIVVFFALLVAASLKVSASHRWQEAIEIYLRISSDAVVNSAASTRRRAHRRVLGPTGSMRLAGHSRLRSE